MNVLLDALHNRHSVPANLLSEPAPNDEQLNDILKCAVTAPDHGKLSPWRFIIIRDEARYALGELLEQAAKERDPDIENEKLEKIKSKPLRSPLIIVIVTTITADHPKTPEVEQTLSSGAAIQLMQLGATALGFGSIWLSGANTYDENVKTGLGIARKDQIAGFLYLGTPDDSKVVRKRPDVSDHVSEWTQPLS